MITITERECTEEELREKEKELDLIRTGSTLFQMEPISIIMFWLLALLCSSFFFSPISFLLWFFDLEEHPTILKIQSNPVILNSLWILWITLLSIPMIWLYKRKLDREREQEVELIHLDLQTQKIEVKTISHIVEAWEIIEDTCCLSPSYLFKTEEKEFFSIITDDLLDFWPEEDEELESDIIREEFVYEKWIGSGIKNKMTMNGEIIKKSGYLDFKHLVDLDNEEKVSAFFSNELNQFPESIEETVRKHSAKEIEDCLP